MGVVEFFLATLGLVGLTDQLDRAIRAEYKRAIASYICADRFSVFASFEQAVIKSVLQPFLHDNGSPRALRLLALCIASSLLVQAFDTMQYLNIEVLNSNRPPDWSHIAALVLQNSYFAYVAFPAGYFSLWVARRIFLDKPREYRYLALWWLLDIFVSVVLPAGFLLTYLLGVVYLANPQLATSEGALTPMAIPRVAYEMKSALLPSLVVSAVLSVLYAVVVLVGAGVRTFCLAMNRLVGVAFDPERVRERPITLVTVIALALGIAVTALARAAGA